MKFFIDTANTAEIKKAAAMGMVDGVTTNPTLLAKETGKARDLYQAICALVDGPVHVEANSLDSAAIVKEGRELAAIHPNMVIKIPVSVEGLIAVRQLEKENIHTNVTLIFSPLQALAAAKAGASYVCPFVGRLDDTSSAGMELIEQIVNIYHNYRIETEVLVASIRSPLHVRDAALIGADAATIPYKVIEQLIRHPLTDLGMQSFLKDWEKVKGRA
jgi:transaldolase